MRLNTRLFIAVALLFAPRLAFAQESTVRGIVLDGSTQQPIAAATVIAVESIASTITNSKGLYQISTNLPATLRIACTGYAQREINVSAPDSFDTVYLDIETKDIDEAIVVGFGSMKRADFSTSVAQVDNMKEIKKRYVPSLAHLVQGQIPGITVINQGGHPTQAAQVYVRGIGSVSGESPLVVVDGVPNAPYSIENVESVTVLRDAASAAIYGAHAGSAGIILISTKGAENGPVRVELSHGTTFSLPRNLPQSLTIDEERRVRAIALGGENNLPTGWNAAINPYIAETRTDWIDETFRTAISNRSSVSINGGNSKIAARGSFESNRVQGTILNTYRNSYTTNLNLAWNPLRYVTIQENFGWAIADYKDANTSSAESGVILSALIMPRNAEVYDHKGDFGGTAPSDPAYIAKYGSNFAEIHGDVINPIWLLLGQRENNKQQHLSSSTLLELKGFLPGLSFTSRFTYATNQYNGKSFTTRRAAPGKPELSNSLVQGESHSREWETENRINYDTIISRHSIGIMAAHTASGFNESFLQAKAREFVNEDPSLTYFSMAGLTLPPTDGRLLDRNLGAVGRIAYNWADRYFITASLRADWAGRLPKGHKAGLFPAVSGAWKISSEPFMENVKWMDLLKIRASWGRIGNLGSIPMGYAYPTISINYFMLGGGGATGGQVGQTPGPIKPRALLNAFNANLTWETSDQQNYGLDVACLNNRLTLTVDFFIKKTIGIIRRQDYGFPTIIGLDAPLINNGKIKNQGIEIQIGWKDHINDFSYSLNGNFATLKNRVIDMGKGENDEPVIWTDGPSFKNLKPYQSQVGQPLYSYYLYKTNGVFQTDEEAKNYVNNNGEMLQPKAKAGDLKFIDLNGDGAIDDLDRQYMGNAMPSITYAFNCNFAWKGISLAIMLQGVNGVKIFNAAKFITLNESEKAFNRDRRILKALNGPTYEVPRISASDDNQNFSRASDWYLEDGSYLRIKNISLGYDFTNLLRRWQWFNQRYGTAVITLSASNVYTFSRYSGIDPEVGGLGLDGGQYPVATDISLGLKISF